MYSPTASQQEVLRFIEAHIATHGVAPSFREIKLGLKRTSTSKVHRQVLALEERGWLCRNPHQARSIVLLSPSNAQVIPTVSYPDAKIFVWSEEAKALVPMEVRK